MDPKKYCYGLCQRVFCLCFPLGILKMDPRPKRKTRNDKTLGVLLFLVLRLGLGSILSLFIFYFYEFILFIYFWLPGSLGCTWAFSSCSERGYSLLRCTGFSLRWLLLLQTTGSRCTGFSSCGTQAQ